MNEIKIPKRATPSKFVRTDSQPTIEETLRYMLLLLRTDLHEKGKMVQQANELEMEVRRYQRLTLHPHWVKARELVEKHQEARTRERTFGEYVFKHLSPEARDTWKELQFWAEHQDGQLHIEKIMSGRAKKIRQELFIHALVSTHFDISNALRMTGLSKKVLEQWRQDFHFGQLFDEVQWHKKNFFEKAMLDLVQERNPYATVWANKTVNADRGYSEKVRIEHAVDVGFTFEELDLDADTRRKVLEAIRRRQLKNGAEKANGQRRELSQGVVDVEAVEAED